MAQNKTKRIEDWSEKSNKKIIKKISIFNQKCYNSM